MAFIAINRHRFYTIQLEFFRKCITALTGFGKHQHLLPIFRANQIREQFAFALFIHRIHHLLHGFCRGIGWRHLHFDRITHDAIRHRFDFAIKRCREKQRLTQWR
ncbi:Uncharacterised protein [Vibrio cholerae]|nr:Uncharacterised protein [Vibrio cholerae]CSC91893.1 Uncharacterised protein [Vibrio cholerae]CSD55831.1 Uncharacterised protein [Vibrio cholerae]CSI38215.1 Uncharacterised protein [Vibrio cholerae]